MEALQPYASAGEVRGRNARLDAEIRELAQQVPDQHLHDEFSDDDRTLAEKLGHLAELSTFFARQLDEWIDGRRMVVGRVAEHDPDHNDALARATLQQLPQLLASLDAALATMERTLARLCDDHLTATIQNVRYGREPLTSFLQRYVIGHKAAHAHELRHRLAEL